jgi:hypothetical protein
LWSSRTWRDWALVHGNGFSSTTPAPRVRCPDFLRMAYNIHHTVALIITLWLLYKINLILLTESSTFRLYIHVKQTLGIINRRGVI